MAEEQQQNQQEQQAGDSPQVQPEAAAPLQAEPAPPEAARTEAPPAEAQAPQEPAKPAPPATSRPTRPGDRSGPRRRGGGQPGRHARGQRDRDRGRSEEESAIESAVVRIYRCSKVVKGGRTFSFGALVVAGDRRGQVGVGYGKANEVPPAVEKGTKDARKNMFKVNLKGSTIPHAVKGRAGASTVMLVPARPGTGVTAGKSVRPVLELVGIVDILTKAYGSTAPKNLVKATIDALRQLQNREEVERLRGVELSSGAGELVTA